MNTKAVYADISAAKKLGFAYTDWIDLLGKMDRLDAYELNTIIAHLLAIQASKLNQNP